MAFNPGLGFVLAQQLSAQEGLPPNRQIFYGALGAVLASPVGLGVTLALANQEAEAQTAAQPPPQPQLQVPGQVTGLTVTGTTTNSVSLSWTPPSTGGAVMTYAVQFTPHNANTWATASSSGPGTNATVGGLVTGTSYDFQVIAANAAGFGPPSAIVTATPAQLAAPGQVTGLAASAPTINSITLNWSAPTTGGPATNYTVQFRTPPGTGNFTPVSTPDAATTFQVTGLTASTSYDFQVSAVNAAGSGMPSAITTASTLGPALAAAAAEGHRGRSSGHGTD